LKAVVENEGKTSILLGVYFYCSVDVVGEETANTYQKDTIPEKVAALYCGQFSQVSK